VPWESTILLDAGVREASNSSPEPVQRHCFQNARTEYLSLVRVVFHSGGLRQKPMMRSGERELKISANSFSYQALHLMHPREE